ncbi:MAG TPA: FecR domain-containing protein [Bacteroidales bacterium]|nr:FecR domain-containing protein [Bacteroidales bacterium]
MSENGDTYKHNASYSGEEWNELLKNLRVPASKTREEAWRLFVEALPVNVAKKRSLNYILYALAASIALLTGIFGLYYEKETSIWCQPASIQTVLLPDGSEVILNAASEIKFKERRWNTSRQVKLDGEAFFKVKKGSRFEVLTGNGKVIVLGTTFNVFSRDKRFDVYCATGKVAVVTSDTAFITAGSKALSFHGGASRIMKGQLHESSWRKGDFWFSNTPLSDVIAELERQFDVTILLPDISERYYTGYFNRSSLSDALSTVFSPMQLRFKIKDKIIQIY